jgi:hypothetical protein
MSVLNEGKSMEKLWDDVDRGKSKNSEKSLSLYHSVRLKSTLDLTGPSRENSVTKDLRHGTAQMMLM